MWDEDRQRFERKLLWGVGNGWAAAGMTRVIRALPDTMKSDKDRIAGYVRELLDACLKFQRTDGLFHDVLDDPSTFVETNAAQMFAYAIYRGVKGGWLAPSYAGARRPDASRRARAGRQVRPRPGGLRCPELRSLGHGDGGAGLLPPDGGRLPGLPGLTPAHP